MRKFLQLALLILVSAASFAQVTVTGTVVDPNGNPFANGTATGQSVAASGQATYSTSPIATSATGFFTLNLQVAATWVFTICAPPVQLGPTVEIPRPSRFTLYFAANHNFQGPATSAHRWLRVFQFRFLARPRAADRRRSRIPTPPTAPSVMASRSPIRRSVQRLSGARRPPRAANFPARFWASSSPAAALLAMPPSSPFGQTTVLFGFGFQSRSAMRLGSRQSRRARPPISALPLRLPGQASSRRHRAWIKRNAAPRPAPLRPAARSSFNSAAAEAGGGSPNAVVTNPGTNATNSIRQPTAYTVEGVPVKAPASAGSTLPILQANDNSGNQVLGVLQNDSVLLGKSKRSAWGGQQHLGQHRP